MKKRVRIALISHDGKKTDMREWAVWNRELLSRLDIYATQHTGELVMEGTWSARKTGLRGRILAMEIWTGHRAAT